MYMPTQNMNTEYGGLGISQEDWIWIALLRALGNKLYPNFYCCALTAAILYNPFTRFYFIVFTNIDNKRSGICGKKENKENIIFHIVLTFFLHFH